MATGKACHIEAPFSILERKACSCIPSGGCTCDATSRPTFFEVSLSLTVSVY